MSAANAFALLDDEGTLDASALAAKIPVAVNAKEPVKSSDGTFGTMQAASRHGWVSSALRCAPPHPRIRQRDM